MTRTFDTVLALIALFILSPLFGLVSALVWLGSSGPAFFRQTRVGKNGRNFSILKFRSMEVATVAANSGPLVTSQGDERITRIGRFLRSTKLDELPQLINVVRGEMSLVGPRPEVPLYVAEWTDSQRKTILSVRPGITDPASVRFRRESEILADQTDPESYYKTEILPAKAQIYVEYVNSRSFVGDIRILFGTIRSVLAA